MNKEHLIAQYFSKSLSFEAQKEFDHLMATDSEFAKEIEFQNNLKTAIKKEEQDALKKELQALEAEENTTTFNYKKWFIAASFIALLALPSFWYFNNSIDTEELFVENFEPYRNIVQPIVRGEQKEDLTSKAFEAYESKDYNNAILHFNSLLNEAPNTTISFYKANTLLQLNKTDEAIEILKENAKITDTLQDRNLWYLALAYLKENNIEDSKKTLQQLVSTSEFKSKSAKDLLENLK